MKLKELRVLKNLSQAQMAQILNTSQNTISNYEKGNTDPSIAVLKQIAKYFDVSLDYLCEYPFNNNLGYIPEERKETIKTLLELSDNEFKEVAAFVRGFKSGKEKTEDFEIFKRR